MGDGKFLIGAIIGVAATQGGAAHAQSVVPAAAETTGEASDIIVTGTRRSERTSEQSIAPIDIVDRRSLAATASADLDDKLAASVPSFSVQSLPGNDGAIFSRPASLRNLSPDETLVLVDGHRRHRSAFVDVVNQGAEAVDLLQIPSPAIGHVEVLRDGASAQYGSDAIAGVINVILDDAPGTELTAQTGQYYAGDGFNVQFTGRSGFTLPGGGILAVSGDYNRSNPTDRSIGIKNKIGQPQLRSYHFTYDLKLPLSDRSSLYSFATYGHMTGWSEFGYHSAQAGDAVFGRSFYQNGANAVYPNWSLSSIYPNGFATQFGANINDAEVVAGLKTDITDTFKIDVSGDYGRSSIDYRVRNSINASLGPLSPTAFDAGDIVSAEASANVDANWSLDAGLRRPVNIAFGGAYRSERFQSIAGDVASYDIGPLSDLPSGSYGFPGISPVSAGVSSRRSESGYLDVESDITSRLTLGLAGRYEHFSNFGSNFSYKFSGRYQVNDAIAVRATYNTGFHAPAPGQQHFTKISSEPDASVPPPYPVLRLGLLSPSDPLAVALGGKPLKPEKSRNVSAGIVLHPLPGFTFTTDYYHIIIDDRIGLTPQLSVPAGSIYDRIQFLINGYDTRSDGVDVVTTWSRPIADGKFGITAAYNYNRTRITHANPEVVTAVSRPYIESARPHHTLITTVTYDQARFHILGRVRYYGSWVDALPIDQSPLTNQKVSPLAFADFSISYDVSSGTKVTVGANNIFDTYPDRVTSLVKYLGYKYPFLRPYEEDGGSWYVRLSQKL